MPDFDPNDPGDVRDLTKINRINVGVYEMGSTFKALSLAMALESGKVNLGSHVDARDSLRYGRFTIHDFHATHRVLTVPEVFTHSSNIGAARLALMVGVEGHKAFLRKMGQLDRLRTELPESAEPLVPRHWSLLNTMTIAFGQGLNVAPIQAVMAVCALANGGEMMTPTFLPRSEEEAAKVSHRVISEQTSESMRYLMRSNATHGSASFANIPGYYVGGKTGTADKIIHGHYSQNKVFTTFMAITPADKPKYLYLTIYDDPQATPEDHGYPYRRLQRRTGRRRADSPGRTARRRAADEGGANSAVPHHRPTGLWSRRRQDRQGVSFHAMRRLGDILELKDADRALASRAIAGLAFDSRKTAPGDVFFALAGAKDDGLKHVGEAVAKGAAAIVAERWAETPNAAFVHVADARAALAHAAARFYPRQPETIVAVTGTSGKTSVAAFVRQIWQALGREAASIGTIGVVSRPLTVYGSLTTPDPDRVA